MKTLVLGGVRSGKSRLAETFAVQSAQPVTYIATATAGDKEMQRRIELHQNNRPQHWHVIEEPIQLADALRASAQAGHCVIVDCLTLWLTNLLVAENDGQFIEQKNQLLKLVPALQGTVIFVGNETSMGIMPLGELTRRFGDESGMLHQSLARLCDCVVLTVAGLPLYLKGENK